MSSLFAIKVLVVFLQSFSEAREVHLREAPEAPWQLFATSPWNRNLSKGLKVANVGSKLFIPDMSKPNIEFFECIPLEAQCS